jgi:hypothetical protein
MSEPGTTKDQLPRERSIDLCRRMMHYSLFADRTQERRASEVKEALRFFFEEDVIQHATDDVCGRQRRALDTPEQP